MKKYLSVLICMFCCTCTMGYAHPSGPVLMVVGTRPEMIKMMPVYRALKKADLPVFLCSTGQHADLLEDLFELFAIRPDRDLKVMKPAQDLAYLTEAVLNKTHALFQEIQPRVVIVQGDTATAFASALSAFYLKIPVAHVEAGLRSGNLQKPFPEEMNRRAITLLTSVHFPPTQQSYQQLLAEGVEATTIHRTGNTVVDALYSVRDQLQQGVLTPNQELVQFVQESRKQGFKLLLLTAHRRESFHGGIESIFDALKQAMEKDPKLAVIYPAHPNPVIQTAIREKELSKLPRLQILKPLPYQDLVYLLDTVDGVATDSGGIQEEAMSLGKRVVVLRGETDRPEGLEEGLARLTGSSEIAILEGIDWIFSSDSSSTNAASSLFGDGKAGERIAAIIKERYFSQSTIDSN